MHRVHGVHHPIEINGLQVGGCASVGRWVCIAIPGCMIRRVVCLVVRACARVSRWGLDLGQDVVCSHPQMAQRSVVLCADHRQIMSNDGVNRCNRLITKHVGRVLPCNVVAFTRFDQDRAGSTPFLRAHHPGPHKARRFNFQHHPTTAPASSNAANCPANSSALPMPHVLPTTMGQTPIPPYAPRFCAPALHHL